MEQETKEVLRPLNVARGEIFVKNSNLICVKDQEFAMDDFRFKKLLGFATLQKKSFSFAEEMNSPEYAVDTVNKFLQTRKEVNQNVAVFVDEKGFVGISEKERILTVEEFLFNVDKFCERFDLEKRSIGTVRGSLTVSCTIPSDLSIVSEIYRPEILFTYSTSQVCMNIGLLRLACTNGAITRLKGTSVNLEKSAYYKIADASIDRILQSPYEIYAPVFKAIEKLKQENASVGDLMEFERNFRPFIGDEKTSQYFPVNKISQLYPNAPENPPKMWLNTAQLPITAFDLYNIGTNLTSHIEGLSDLSLMIFLGRYLFKRNSLKDVCRVEPEKCSLFSNIEELRGDLR
jgi:hypothetical protein